MYHPAPTDFVEVWQGVAVSRKTLDERRAVIDSAPPEYRARIRSHLKTYFGLKKVHEKRLARRAAHRARFGL